MPLRRAGLFAGLFWTSACAAAVAATTPSKHNLQGVHHDGETTRVEVSLQVGGDLKLVDDGKPKTLAMSVVANLKYDEKLLRLDAAKHPGRSVRHYDEARAVIKVEKGGEKPTLSDAHRVIVVEKPAKAAAALFCPVEALNREELDLVDVPGNTLILDQLLPAEPKALGDTWKLSDHALVDLLGLDAISWSDVQSALGEVKDNLAEIAAAGSVSGAIGGVSTEIELKAKYFVDLKAQRINYLALLIKEKRSVGHIGPGLDTVAKLIVKISPLTGSEGLSAAVVAQARQAQGEHALQLSYLSPGGQFRVEHDRRWYLTSDDAKLTVMRLLDRGELVAQCNVSELPATKQPVTLAEFQHDVQASLGKGFGQFASASEATNDAGYRVFRVVVEGTVGTLPIEWIYYLVADQHQHRVSLAFTLEQSLRERFKQADRDVCRQLRLLEAPTPTAAKAKTTR